jgi:hypothetical protein
VSAVEGSADILELLYRPYDLVTNERRCDQIVLLSELVQQIKTAFNVRFQECMRTKQDEIVKIEDKNERLKEILRELDIQGEKLFIPSLKDEEAPERCLEVQNDEITAEKVVSH